MRKYAIWFVAGALFAAIVGAGGAWVYAKKAPGPMKITWEDYVEIQTLYAKYAYAVDGLGQDGRGEPYADVFTDDGELNVVGVHDKHPVKGREALIEFAKKGLEKGPAKQRHVITNLVVTPIDENTARGEVLLMLVNSASNPATLVSNRATADILRKTPKGWRIQKRTNSLISTNTPFTRESQ
jgi:hypothetical protein